MNALTRIGAAAVVYSRCIGRMGIVAMYTIELTRGAAWDAPIIEAHAVRPSLHIVDIERMAQAFLNTARQKARRLSPTDYRIRDALGRCVRSSAQSGSGKTSIWRAGRTCWSNAR